ncbi:MAG: hypothetical protein HY586_07570 [Candidatus Omnitrophica bacterium]|nr:hypothetical protein [Candidatus Omnitrophota bacterium]
MFHYILPIIPLTLAGALFFKRKSLAYGFPVVLVLIKGLLTSFYPLTFFITLGYLFAVFIARNLKKLLGAGAWASTIYAGIAVILFQLISNFGVWIYGGCDPAHPSMYAHTISDLAKCYRSALPYIGAHLLRDIPMTFFLVLGVSLLSKTRVSLFAHTQEGKVK